MAGITRSTRRGAVLALLTGWVISLALPVADLTGSSSGPVAGLNVLALGWMGVMGLVVAWYANLLLVAVCWQLWRDQSSSRGWALGRGCLMLLLASDALLWKSMSHAFPDQVVRYREGFWLWFAVMLTAGALALVDARRERMAP